MRAADGGESARFSRLFLASGFSCFQAESTLRPTAANASRWHAPSGQKDIAKTGIIQ